MIGARAHFCAGHTLPQHPELHGHSYEVWAYRSSGCAEQLQRDLADVVKQLDHKMLNDIIPDPTMEEIGRYVGSRLNALKVRVVRPVEGLCSEISSY